jgi:hypothetical protein
MFSDPISRTSSIADDCNPRDIALKVPFAPVVPNDFRRKLHSWAASHISHFAGFISGTTSIISHGSCYFIDFSDNLFMITAAHVYDGFLQAMREHGNSLTSCVGDCYFDPEDRLRDCNRELDIVTFDFTYDELVTIQKQAVQATQWPPPAPVENNNAVLAGFPGRGRRSFGELVVFGSYIAQTPITAVYDRNIICRFNRENWIEIGDIDLPLPGADLRGLSGGPLLLPCHDRNGVWHLCLGGTISEAYTSAEFETVVSTRAHFINFDGSISRI